MSSAPVPSITARPSREEKERFTELAAKCGLSESALAVIAIRRLLAAENMDAPVPSSDGARTPATDRITVRLRPGDARAIADRAARRGMKASSYLAALIRAHVAKDPPLPAHELAALKQVVVALTAQGRHLARISQELREAGGVPRDLAHQLLQARRVADQAESIACAFALAAVRSWESPHG